VNVLILENDDGSTIGSDTSSISIDAADDVDLRITGNDGSSIVFSDVTIVTSGGDVDIDLQPESGAITDGTISLGDIHVTTADDFDFDADGNGDDESVSVGHLHVVSTSDDEIPDGVVDIDANAVGGLWSITVSDDVIDLDIDFGDMPTGPDLTWTETTLIDLSGMTNADADIDIDFVTPGFGAANMSDDMVIKFGEFADAYVETYINDYHDTADVDDLEGVRQTYVFEGSDIGDIVIEGFVAGAGAYRDVDINGGPGAGNEDGRGAADGGGGPGSDWFDYSTSNSNGLALIRTDRLDLSQFEGVDSLDDLVFEFSDADDSVIITAADGQFDGSIIVTGLGVDADSADEDEQTIIDRVQDSIIFG